MASEGRVTGDDSILVKGQAPVSVWVTQIEFFFNFLILFWGEVARKWGQTWED